MLTRSLAAISLTLALSVAGQYTSHPQWNWLDEQREELRAIKKASEAYVYVGVSYAGQERNGSGACVGGHHILTVAHLVPSDAAKLSVGRLPDDLLRATVVALDTKRDLMLLRSRRKCETKLKISNKTPRVGQSVATFAAPMGADGVLFLGNVAAVEKGRFMVDVTTMHGQSGAAVVQTGGQESGNLMGVVSMAWGDLGSGIVTVAIDAASVREFLDDAGFEGQ